MPQAHGRGAGSPPRRKVLEAASGWMQTQPGRRDPVRRSPNSFRRGGPVEGPAPLFRWPQWRAGTPEEWPVARQSARSTATAETEQNAPAWLVLQWSRLV